MEKIKILLVDDEPDILEVLSYNLKAEGYTVITGRNGKEAVQLNKKHSPHLILLDVMMPIMNGFKACKKIRQEEKFNNTLIAFLSARNEDLSLFEGYDVGADDYINKPIKPFLLIKKIKALLRRQSPSINEKEIKIGELVINQRKHRVLKNNVEVSLPKKEFKLLCLLSSSPDKVFKREDIMDIIWGDGVVVGDRTIDVHIRKLRKKIGENFFKTIKGVGYKFVSP